MVWLTVEIADDDELYRRLAPHHLRPDGSVSSVAFLRNSRSRPNRREPDPDISVDLARLTTPEESLARAERPTHGIGALQAEFPRALGLTVRLTPDLATNNPAHASIEGNSSLENCHLLAEQLSRRVLIYPSRG